jgi:bacterioferritin
MIPSHPTSARDRERISALAAGLAATVISWTFAAAFAPEKLEALGHYSPWLYGPAATAAWALFSAIAYLLLRRDRRREAPSNAGEGYRCRELGVEAPTIGCTVCANQAEKNRLGAVTAGFALTIGTWVAALSFMPEGWLDWLGEAPAWIYCILSIVLWAASSVSMYLIFRASDGRPHWNQAEGRKFEFLSDSPRDEKGLVYSPMLRRPAGGARKSNPVAREKKEPENSDNQKRRLDMGQFSADVKQIRERARQHIEAGAVTQGYKADREQVTKVLNDVLATEIVCVLRYKRHYYMAQGISSDSVKAEFLQHANEEQQHADWVAERITQIGGEPNFNPEGLATRSHSEYKPGESLTDMIKEDLVAERIAVESYSEIIRWLGNDDPTSRVLMEQILKMEEEHANDMSDLLAKMSW